MDAENKDQGSAGNVMDVQAPKAQPALPVAETTPVAEQPTSPPVADSAPVDAPVVAEDSPSNPVQDASTEAQADQKPEKPKKNHKKAKVVVLAVLVFGALAGVAGYAYMQSQEEPAPASEIQQEPETDNAADTKPATTKEVTDSAKELDDAVNAADEASELPEEGLNEGAVGL